MAYTFGKQVSDGSPTGLGVGQSTTDKVGFFGKTARIPITFVTSVSAAQTTATVKARINQIRAGLINLGLMAAS